VLLSPYGINFYPNPAIRFQQEWQFLVTAGFGFYIVTKGYLYAKNEKEKEECEKEHRK